jgi:hypothetical protein
MNDVYFACRTCQVMTNAGYRWACVQLEEPGVVSVGERVSAAAVFAAREYWSPGEEDDSAWLRFEVLPIVKVFLEKHGSHELAYGDAEQVTGEAPTGFIDWLEVGPSASPSPRWFVEVLGLRTWADVLAWSRENPKPWWWAIEELKDIARVRFGELVKRAAG